jgi:putative protease
MGITRHAITPVKTEEPFQSPKNEEFWCRRYGQNTWIYPAWPLDITPHKPELEKAGYSLFAAFTEWPPKTVSPPKRSSAFNWDIGLL